MTRKKNRFCGLSKQQRALLKKALLFLWIVVGTKIYTIMKKKILTNNYVNKK